MFKVGIIGATGYVGAELFRLLLNHSEVKVEAISSVSYEGQDYASIYNNFFDVTDLVCDNSDTVIEKCDLVFTALPHGLSEEIAAKCVENNKLCIDLGADFRLDDNDEYKHWYGKDFAHPELHKLSIYALPEFNRDKIKGHKIIANPGCYPTSIELALMPLLKNSLIDTKRIICDSKSGTTGAGRGLALKTHYPECNENFAAYAVGSHRHTPEIELTLSKMSNSDVSVIFTPHLLPINRGILSTIYCRPKDDFTLEEIHKLYTETYKNEKFVHVLPLGETACIRNIKFTNNCNISIHTNVNKDELIIISTIDNMVKGAAGQAIQNMNILLGLEEDTGLKYIAPAF